MSRWLPPEWAPQAAMLLVWPRARADWGHGLAAARATVAAMAATLCRYQPVIMVAADAQCRASIADRPELAGFLGGRLVVVTAANDDIWARDTGPITVYQDGQRVFVDFRFNGWGGRFAADHDDRLCAALYGAGVFGDGRCERREYTLEGGSIEVDGAGAVLTTRRCLLDGARNAGIDRRAAEAVLRAALGVHTVHWLVHGGLIGDDTDGHIDTLARFAGPDTLVYQGCDDRRDPHHSDLAAMAEEIAGLRGANGAPYRCVALPLPAPIHDPVDGHRLPAGYANFLIANGCVLVPCYDDPADALARTRLAPLFPDRDIQAIDCRALIGQHGGIHCAAMQIPAEPSDA